MTLEYYSYYSCYSRNTNIFGYSFGKYVASEYIWIFIRYIMWHPNIFWYSFVSILWYSLITDPSLQKVSLIWAYMCSRLRVHSNHSLCPSVSKFTAFLYSVHQDPIRQKVAFIWAYTCSILGVHSNHSLCPSVPKFTDPICSVHQDPSRQKVASNWAFMCSTLRVHSNH